MGFRGIVSSSGVGSGVGGGVGSGVGSGVAGGVGSGVGSAVSSSSFSPSVSVAAWEKDPGSIQTISPDARLSGRRAKYSSAARSRI